MSTTQVEKVLGKYATFENDEVKAVALEIPSIGGGLNDAIKVEPFLMHGGDKAYLVVEVDCDKIRHDPYVDRNAGEKRADRVGQGGPWTRVQILVPGTVAFVDEDLVRDLIVQQADRVRAMKDEEDGQPQIPGVGDGTQTAEE